MRRRFGKQALARIERELARERDATTRYLLEAALRYLRAQQPKPVTMVMPRDELSWHKPSRKLPGLGKERSW